MAYETVEDIAEKNATEARSGRLQYGEESDRIIVVCPYDSFNSYFGFVIKDIFGAKELDIMKKVAGEDRPFDVVEREKRRVIPSHVIDFGFIIVGEGPARIVDFLDYRDWARKEEIALISLRESIAGELAQRHTFDQHGNFVQDSVGNQTVKFYHDSVVRDLERIAAARVKNRELTFFDVRYP